VERIVKKALFADLLASTNEALAHAQKKRSLRITVLPDRPQSLTAAALRRMRDDVHMSQAVFARHLNVSTKLVQAWESGQRQPDGPALRLLELEAQHPHLVFGDAGRKD
jgi:putative transcriptional regulator